MLKRYLSIIALFFILGLSSQLLLADIYKCESSNGAVSYSEKRCQDGRVQKNGWWKNVEQHEAELYKTLLNKIQAAKIKGMSDADLWLLNSTLEVDYNDLSNLGYSYEQWTRVRDLITLRESSLTAAIEEISHSREQGEMNRQEVSKFNRHEFKKLTDEANKDNKILNGVLLYVRKLTEERTKEQQRANEEAQVKKEARAKKEGFRRNERLRAARATYISQITEGDAIQICSDYAKAHTLYQNSFDFSIFIDLYTRKRYDGGWLVTSTFTVKNAYNMQIKHDISCVVSATGIVTEGVID